MIACGNVYLAWHVSKMPSLVHFFLCCTEQLVFMPSLFGPNLICQRWVCQLCPGLRQTTGYIQWADAWAHCMTALCGVFVKQYLLYMSLYIIIVSRVDSEYLNSHSLLPLDLSWSHCKLKPESFFIVSCWQQVGDFKGSCPGKVLWQCLLYLADSTAEKCCCLPSRKTKSLQSRGSERPASRSNDTFWLNSREIILPLARLCEAIQCNWKPWWKL